MLVYSGYIEAILLSSLGFRLASLAGTLPAGGSFCSGKRNQNPPRAFPPRYPPGVPGWVCVKSGFGPSVLLWLLFVPPHQAPLGSWPYGVAVSISGPTLEKRRSRRWEPGSRQLETVAHQGKALEVEEYPSRGVGANRRRASHLCDPTGPRAGNRRMHTPPSTAGWIPQGGGRPRLWRFFRLFLIAEKETPAERPCQGRWLVPEIREKARPSPVGPGVWRLLGHQFQYRDFRPIEHPKSRDGGGVIAQPPGGVQGALSQGVHPGGPGGEEVSP